MAAAAIVVAARADGDQIAIGEDRPRFVEGDPGHDFHPVRILAQISSAFFAA